MITCPCGCTSFYVLEVFHFQNIIRLQCRACEAIIVTMLDAISPAATPPEPSESHADA